MSEQNGSVLNKVIKGKLWLFGDSLDTDGINPYYLYPDPEEMYKHTLDPFVALGAAAAVTERILLGTGVCLVIEHDPIVLAKEVATLDLLSNGRVLFGVGGGWNAEEMENHGTDYKFRWGLLRERVEAMKVLWTEDTATYHGKYVNFDAVWQWPKPVQRPHPPVMVGGDGERTLQRVVRYGDEWMPTARGGPERTKARMAELADLAQAAGRGPIPTSLFGCPATEAAFAPWLDVGLKRLAFMLPSEPEAAVVKLLDELVKVRERAGL